MSRIYIGKVRKVGEWPVLVIETKYNENFVREIKNVPGRKWDGKRNIVYINPDKKNAYSALELVSKYFVVDVSEVKKQLDGIKVPTGYVGADSEYLLFDFPYNNDIIKDLKTVKATWDKKRRVWKIRPKSATQIRAIRELIDDWQFTVLPEASELLEKAERKFEEDKARKAELLEMSKRVHSDLEIPLPPGLTLYPFQRVGVEWLERTNGRALIGDEMGLGKTVQSLAWLRLHPEIRPVIVVCPASVKLNWSREIRKWTGEDVTVIKGKNGVKKLPETPFYVINYDILTAWLEKLQSINAKCLIVDECHYIKNSKAKRTKAVLQLGKNIPHVIALTGTPMLNRPIELYTTIKLLKVNDPVLRDFWTYAKRFCDAQQTPWGWDFSGASNLDELQVRLRQSVMIRRLKKYVLRELPPKRRIMVPMEISNRKDYVMALKNFREWYLERKGKEVRGAEVLVQLEQLRQLAVMGKLDAVIEWLKDIPEKFVVFAVHRSVQRRLVDELNALWIPGGLSAEEKQRIVDEFNNSDRPLVVSLYAGAEGMNLQTARIAVFVELPWTPGKLLQAEDRIHRIGQENCVDIYYLLAEGTVEEKMMATIQRKQEIISNALDGLEDVEENKIIFEVAEQIIS